MLKNLHRKKHVFVIMLLLNSCLVFATKKTSFVLVGHVYDQVNNLSNQNLLISKINEIAPDKVFFLGDANCWKKETHSTFINKINAHVFFAPGNHDLRLDTQGIDRKSEYINNIGYLNKVFSDSICNYIVVNSSTSKDSINAFIDRIKTQLDNNKPNIILTHHRIWDDNLLSSTPYEHDKSYTFNELNISGIADFIFAGNSPRQYFGDQYKKGRPINRNIVYWTDIVNNIQCHSIGSNGFGNITFVECSIDLSGKLSITPYSIAESDSKVKTVSENKKITKKESGLIHRIINSRFVQGFIFALILFSISLFTYVKVKR